LTLKNGIPIMLLRNLSPPSMGNGTRLLIKELKNNLIVATIITGPAAGQLAHIPRIPMIPTDLPIPFKRLQFPVKIFFTLTINKSLGQPFELVGTFERNVLLMANCMWAYHELVLLIINLFCCHKIKQHQTSLTEKL